MSTLRLTRAALGVWGVFDVATGLASLFAPSLVATAIWPSAHADARIMLRRAGAFWLAMGVAQLLAAWRPTSDRLRLAGIMRCIDGVADAAWLASVPAFSTNGWATIGPSPALCFAVGGLALYAARATGARA